MAGVAAVPVTALAQLSAAQELAAEELAAERPKTLDKAPLASARGMRTENSCILVLKEGKVEWSRIRMKTQQGE
jgi:hypothetical protein